MTQVDFNKLFKHRMYKPLNYKLRDGANRAHDIIFLASYIHDAALFLKNIALKKGRMVIPMERICWELEDSNVETHTCMSHIFIDKVSDYSFAFHGDLLKNWEFPSKVSISDFSLSETEEQSVFKFLLLTGCKLPEFEMTVLSAKKGSRLVIKDEADTFI